MGKRFTIIPLLLGLTSCELGTGGKLQCYYDNRKLWPFGSVLDAVLGSVYCDTNFIGLGK